MRAIVSRRAVLGCEKSPEPWQGRIWVDRRSLPFHKRLHQSPAEEASNWGSVPSGKGGGL